jgi:Concanavalin A-like lectin/glucanases superfamily
VLGIALQSGLNSVTVTARDAAGNTAQDTLAVTYTPATPAGLVAAWGFNEGTGTTTADTSGNGNTGTISGATWTTAGRYGKALTFDGVNDFVNLGNPGELQLTGSMTVSGWINAAAFPVDDAAVVSKRSSDAVGYQLDTTVDRGPRTIGFKISNAAGTSTVARYGATTLQVSTWYHVAGVYDAAAQTLKVYLNGQLDNGVLLGTVPTSQPSTNVNLHVGQRPGSPGTYNFQGRLDDIRIYNRALSQAEIQADMTTPVGGTAP